LQIIELILAAEYLSQLFEQVDTVGFNLNFTQQTSGQLPEPGDVRSMGNANSGDCLSVRLNNKRIGGASFRAYRTAYHFLAYQTIRLGFDLRGKVSGPFVTLGREPETGMLKP
jgi:hypothetical protein